MAKGGGRIQRSQLTHGKLQVGSSFMTYQKMGSGPRLLLCFHGYGLDKANFNLLEGPLGGQFTLFSFDHFFHGESEWNEADEVTIDKDELLNALINLCTDLGHHRFSVLAFSLGGKIALSLASSYPDRVEQMILLAPDGIKTSFWYSLATYPLFFRDVLKRIVLKPRIFHLLVAVFRFFRLVDKGILRFAQTQMNSEAKRWRLYKTWVCYKTISVPTDSLISQLAQHRVPIDLYLGRFDKIITEKNLRFFIRKLPCLRLIILPAGHNHLIVAFARLKSIKN
jgi:pimeloyl-ACP methyl ester carboxylesterase